MSPKYLKYFLKVCCETERSNSTTAAFWFWVFFFFRIYECLLSGMLNVQHLTMLKSMVVFELSGHLRSRKKSGTEKESNLPKVTQIFQCNRQHKNVFLLTYIIASQIFHYKFYPSASADLFFHLPLLGPVIKLN